MEQYISKANVVLKIENRIKELQNLNKENENKLDSIQKTAIQLCIDECKVILSLLDTIEIREVDFEKYYHEFLQKEWFNNSHVRTVSEMMAFTAKHFLELGLKIQKGE